MHSISSSINPVTIEQLVNYSLGDIYYNPSYIALFKPRLFFVESLKIYEALFFLTQKVPAEMMLFKAKLPYFGSQA